MIFGKFCELTNFQLHCLLLISVRETVTEMVLAVDV